MILSALKIEPFVSVGPFAFDMTRRSARKMGGRGFRSFKRTAEGQLIDLYEGAVFFNFDKSDRLEAIEMTSPACPTYLGRELLKLSLDQALAYLRPLDPDLVVENDGVLAPSLGISLYAPLAKENVEAPIETILAFRRDYYD